MRDVDPPPPYASTQVFCPDTSPPVIKPLDDDPIPRLNHLTVEILPPADQEEPLYSSVHVESLLAPVDPPDAKASFVVGPDPPKRFLAVFILF